MDLGDIGSGSSKIIYFDWQSLSIMNPRNLVDNQGDGIKCIARLRLRAQKSNFESDDICVDAIVRVAHYNIWRRQVFGVLETRRCRAKCCQNNGPIGL